MNRYNNNELIDKSFLTRVVSLSLVILAAAGVLLFLLLGQFGLVKGIIAENKAKKGDYRKALEIVESISDEDILVESKYSIAEHMYANGDYTEAQSLFEQLDTYGDSFERGKQCSYAAALELYRQGAYEDAYERLLTLGNYSDSPQQLLRVRYSLAQQLYDSGDYSRSLVHFVALGDYENSAAKAYEAALAVTGSESEAQRIIELGGISPEELDISLKIREYREAFPQGSIAAGSNHTVLLHADGTVSACGDNTYGQCSVSDWSNVTTVCAGTNHTVALRSDGTVLAAGDNAYGQCNVGSWRNIIAVAACESDTYGLTADGNVVCAGYHDYADIRNAENVTAVYAGSYAAVALTSSGAVIASHGSYSFTSERDILSVAVDTGFYAALQANGKCLSSLEPVLEWEKITCIDAGPKAVIAADIDGRVLSHFFRTADAIDFSSLSGVNQCAAGTDHYVFLHTDGTVTALGDNSYGQCDISVLGSAK